VATRSGLPDKTGPPDKTGQPDKAGTPDDAGRQAGRGPCHAPAIGPGRAAASNDEPGRVDGWQGLLAAAAVGPFFGMDRPRDDQHWFPLSEFADHPDGLDARVTATFESPLLLPLRGSTPDASRTRIAASIAFLGIAARLVSPAIGSTLSAGIVPILGWDELLWRSAPTGIIPLACRPDRVRAIEVRSAADARAVAALNETTITPILTLAAAVTTRLGLSGRVVHGNVASAVAGATAAVARSGRCSERAAVDLSTALLAQPRLVGAGSYSSTGAHPGFRRSSCCLLYRAGGGLCGDCILATDDR
jgi:hypothetical protein